ncbi:hypothetical protein [Teredinibacter sp. KSP-S5-2]|uniref:hypothetical protein n=1 Tax=Teredinibacter sp. KSP-S5-2 TaxID=3034506 RepID=UPI002934399A|nr:hypothetical protein [Teredinibacter sp. KSP-S5-2]WNO10571.1 hypothetical protein P5V12_05230 [Teredinibacter sp. KSP-S5-2]
MELVEPVSDNELEHINAMLSDVNVAVSMSMSYIRKIQKWDFNTLESRFDNISLTTWKKYLQPSYLKMRPLHMVAAFSWLTMVPMPSFYRGLKIRESYRGMDEESVEAMIHCGILPKKQYRLLLDFLYEYLSPSQKNEANLLIQSIREKYGSLEDYDDNDFLFPKSICINKFAEDYYRSVALAFYNFRKTNSLSIETIAKILNLSTYRYKQCENPENPVPLPVDIAARLKLGFKLTDAMPFTSSMATYPQFHTMRKVQHIRETKLVALMKHLEQSHKKHFVGILSNMANLHSTQIRMIR